MREGNPIRVVWRGVADFGRFLSLWFGFGLAANGLSVVLDAALVDEPFGWALWASSLLALAAAFAVHRWYPDVGSETVWRFGVATYLVFVVASTLAGTMDVRTSGSLYYVLKSLLVWFGSLAVGCGVARSDD